MWGQGRFDRAMKHGIEKPSVRRITHEPRAYRHPFEAVGVPFEELTAMRGAKLLPPLPPVHDLPKPANHGDRSANELRPETFSEIVGQGKTIALLERLVASTLATRRPLDHVLLVGPAGTGKTTIANAIANALGTDCYQLEAPVGHETLLDLRKVCKDGDIVFIDEIHQQAAGDRRGRTTNNTPEVFLGVLEDRTLVSGSGPLDFPAVTFIGATTDEGQLPDAFVARFPIRPVLEPYSEAELTEIAERGAKKLGMHFNGSGAAIFARAARATPRIVTNYLKNAQGLAVSQWIEDDLCYEILHDMNGVTDDGLSVDQQRLLKWLLEFGKRVTKDTTTYQASVSTLATAIGKGRDAKSIQLRVEPWLLSSGLLQITSGGRALTPAGIARARQL